MQHKVHSVGCPPEKSRLIAERAKEGAERGPGLVEELNGWALDWAKEV